MSMTLEEAMTDLSIQREVKKRLGKTYEAKSLGVGIEALKRLKQLREYPGLDVNWQIPGETEE